MQRPEMYHTMHDARFSPRPRIKFLWEQHKRFEGTALGEAFYVAYKRATGYRV